MSYFVTGGAGFIGSNMVEALNDRGIDDILVVDNIASTGKWQNLNGKKYRAYIHKNEFLGRLNSFKDVEAVIHLGACSSTTEGDFDYLWKNNVEYTKALWRFCMERQIPFLYASSAATYGDGSHGFDDRVNIDLLRPLNAYGYSKQLFDLWARRQSESCPPQHVGFKFFNVYGPGESFKGSMASMAFHGFRQARESGEIRLFKSCCHDYADGEQLRDFVYVKDVCNVILWFLDHPAMSGLFNVGTGKADSFENLAKAVFHAMRMPANIRYIDMPEHLKKSYQYYTQAEMEKLRSVGCNVPFLNVKDGVEDYVRGYLEQNRALIG